MSRIRTIKRCDLTRLPKHSSLGRYIYLVGEVDYDDVVKIGVATHPIWRLYTHQIGNWRRLELLAAWECFEKADARRIEKAAHEAFAEYRLSGEWYNISWTKACAFISAMAGVP